MALASKFRKDLSTLQAAVNREIFLDHKHPKLYKKLERFYVSQGLATLTDEDPDYDYNINVFIIQKKEVVVNLCYVRMLRPLDLGLAILYTQSLP